MAATGGVVLDCKKRRLHVSRHIGGGWAALGGVTRPQTRQPLPSAKPNNGPKPKRRAAQAKRLWQEAQPIAGTVAANYLRGRGITCDLPPALRFHPETWHGPTAKRFPALVALVEGGDGFAVHRTYLRADGSGKADLDPPKAMLGAVSGGAVRLTNGPGPLVVAEGIETALSLTSGLLQRPATVWAALSTSGIRGLSLPTDPGRLTIAPDGDGPGRAAAHILAERAHGLGWQVAFLDPGDGRDWNDILTGKAAA